MMSSRSVNITIGGKNRLSSVLASALESIRKFVDGTQAGMKAAMAAFRERAAAVGQSLALETAAFEKAHKSALSTYETLDEINKRIDAPRKAAEAQEEHNRALERYNQLLEKAAERQRAVYAKKHFYNAFDPDTFKNLEKLHGSESKDNAAQNATVGMKNMAAAARRAWPALMMVSRAMGEGTGVTAKFGQALTGIAGMFMAFGPSGAIVGAAQAGIDALVGHFKEKADKMVESAKAAASRATQYLDSMKQRRLDASTNRVESAISSADKAMERFDRKAKSQTGLMDAIRRRQSTIDELELEKWRAQAVEDVSRSSEQDRERVAAAWEYEIAKRKADMDKRSSDEAEKAEARQIRLAEERLALAKKHADKLNEIADKEFRNAQHVKELFTGDDDSYVKEVEAVSDKARARAASADADVIRQQDELKVMRVEKQRNDTAREAATISAETAVAKAESEYEKAEKRYADRIMADEIAAAQAAAKERERLDREAHQKRMADLRKEIAAQKEAASVLTSRASAAQSEFDKAFAMYRDPSRAAAEIGEEKDYQNDLDRLHRDARRYGGKWRIDELSRLMSAGDTQGVTDTLKDWRKSRSFTPEVEAMVRASAAESAKTSTLDELRKIETNTAGLDKKLDELLALKGGG